MAKILSTSPSLRMIPDEGIPGDKAANEPGKRNFIEIERLEI